MIRRIKVLIFVGWVRPAAVTHQPAARLARAMPLASVVGYAGRRYAGRRYAGRRHAANG